MNSKHTMRPPLNLSPDEFEMIVNGVDALRHKCLSSLKVANDRIERANEIEARIKAGDKHYVKEYQYRQYRFYKPETIRKKNLEILACNALIRKLSDHYWAYKTYANTGLGFKLPPWKEDCNGKVIDPDKQIECLD